MSRRFFFVRVGAIIEILLFLTLLTAGNYFFLDGERWVDWVAHPFWIIILLVTVQYGLFEGIFAVVASTLFLYADNIPSIHFGESPFLYRFRLSLLPMLWFTAAFILGSIRLRLQAQIDELSEKAVTYEDQCDTIRKAYEMIKAKKENLEVHMTSQLRTVANIYNGFKELEYASPAKIILSMREFIKNSISPEKFSIYFFNGEQFEASLCEGWGKDEPFARRFTLTDPLARELLENRKIVSIINIEHHKILGTEGVIAAPILYAKTGEVFGMVKVESIELELLTLSNLEIFETLCGLIGATLYHARELQELRKYTLRIAHSKKIYTGAFYRIQLEFLQSLRETVEVELHQLTLSFQSDGEEKFEEGRFSIFLEGWHHLLEDLVHLPCQVFQSRKGKDLRYFILAPWGKEKMLRLADSILQGFAKEEALKDFKLHMQVEEIPKNNPVETYG